MLILLDGNLAIDAHLRSGMGYLICLRHSSISRAVTNVFFSEKTCSDYIVKREKKHYAMKWFRYIIHKLRLHLASVKDELPRVCGDPLDVILSQVTRVKPEPWVSHLSSIILVRLILNSIPMRKTGRSRKCWFSWEWEGTDKASRLADWKISCGYDSEIVVTLTLCNWQYFGTEIIP